MGGVYKLDGTTFNISTFSSLSGVGTVSLGNICFDKGDQQFFVADLDHGWIRRLSFSGTEVLPHFDHGTQAASPTVADSGTPNDLTASGRRVFGLQVFGNRLYYSVWHTGKNEIWSVGLDGSGNFILTGPNGPRPEVTSPVFPTTLQNDTPVTDIAFSQSGKMLVAERGLCTAQITNLNTGPAHHSRAMEFTQTAGIWAFNKQYNIGPEGLPNNTEGGIDYTCDDLVLATGDLYAPNGFPNPPLIYGVAILTPSSTGSQTSYLIDADGNTATADKNFLGDVEVYRCCDCLTFSNEHLECLGNNTFSWSFCVTNTGTLTNSHLVLVDLPAGVSVGSQVLDLHPSLPPGQGTCTNIVFTLGQDVKTNNLCFRIAAHTEDFNECCVVSKCLQLPDCCGIVGAESVKCDPAAGTLAWTMTVTNLSGVPASYLVVVPDPAGCVSVANPVISFNPPLANGQAATVTINLAATNTPCDSACFRVSLHDAQFVSCCSFVHCLSLECAGANHPPQIDCASAAHVECDPTVGTNYLLTGGVMDPDGDALTVTWKVNSVPVQTNTIPAGASINFTGVQLIHNYPPGVYTVTLCVTDGKSPTITCDTTLEMGDHTPPSLQCPPDKVIEFWPKEVPNLLGLLVVTDNCSPTNSIKLTQEPPPGSPLTSGHTCINFTATDTAGNSANCMTYVDVHPVRLRGFEKLGNILGTAITTAPADFALSVDETKGALVVGGILLGVVIGPFLLLGVRDIVQRRKALLSDLSAQSVKRFAGVFTPGTGGEAFRQRLPRPQFAPDQTTGEWSIEVLAASGRVWRVQDQPVKMWMMVPIVQVAQTPEMASIAAQWLQPVARSEQGTLLSGRRDLSPGERDELRRFARRLWLRPLPAALGLSLWLGALLGLMLSQGRLPPTIDGRVHLAFLALLTVVSDALLASALRTARRMCQDAHAGQVIIVQVEQVAEGREPSDVVEVLPLAGRQWTAAGRPAAWRMSDAAH